jgi:hypothetical protein
MNPREAKDFLVQQTAKQALLENLSLADLEKRMMYFSESDPASCAKPLELNEEFEAQYVKMPNMRPKSQAFSNTRMTG